MDEWGGAGSRPISEQRMTADLVPTEVPIVALTYKRPDLLVQCLGSIACE